jgi:hypothetical protein
VKLATTLPEATASGKAQDLLNQCFGGKYSDARHYLTEIHILEKAGLFEAKLNRSHTTLGLALLLQQILKVQPKSSPRDLADHLLEKLEPLAGEDGSAEALFVALQLGAIQLTQLDSNGSRQRAALLLAWIFSHNSNVSDERLEFWCSFDTEAYALFFGDLL